MRELYLKFIDVFTKDEEIKDLYRGKGLMPVQHIDLYCGQDVNPEYFELQVYPALFISFALDHRQTPTAATISVRVCYEQLRDTSSEGANIDEALKFLDFIEFTDEIIQTIETKKFGKLTSATTDQQTEETVTDEFILVYSASYTKKTDKQEPIGVIDDVSVKSGLYTHLLD